MSYYNTLGANGENWNNWGSDVFKGGIDLTSNLFTSWMNAKYGNQALQQVQQNPNSDYSQAILQQFLLSQMSQNQQQQTPQTQEKDNTILYVALGIGALALFMMMNNTSNNRR